METDQGDQALKAGEENKDEQVIRKWKDGEWRIVKEEHHIDGNDRVVKKVFIKEGSRKTKWGFDRKEWIDLTLRLVGSMAIFVPLLLFYLQSSSAAKKEHNQRIYNIQTKVLSDVYTFLNSHYSAEEFKKSYNNLVYQSYAEVKSTEDTAAEHSYAILLDLVRFHRHWVNLQQITDSINIRTISPIYTETKEYYNEETEMLLDLQLQNFYGKAAYYKSKLKYLENLLESNIIQQELQPMSLISGRFLNDTAVFYKLREVLRSTDRLNESYTDYANMIELFVSVIPNKETPWNKINTVSSSWYQGYFGNVSAARKDVLVRLSLVGQKEDIVKELINRKAEDFMRLMKRKTSG